MPSRTLIAGGGLPAQRAAETLRARGHDGTIQVICAEPVAPNVFRVDEIAVATGEGPDEHVLEAARACPAMAIEVIDESTGEPVDL